MANELIQFEEYEVGFLDRIENEPNSDILQDAREDRMIPRVLKTKPQQGKTTLVIMIGDHQMQVPSMMAFIPVAVFSRNVLWSPEQGATNRPVCSTKLLSAADFRRAIGSWDDDSGYSNPESPSCARCIWNRFGSHAEWFGKESKAKACRESRRYYALPVSRMREYGQGPDGDPLYLYEVDQQFVSDLNPYGLVVIDMSMSSDTDAIRYVAETALAIKKPIAALAFRLKSEPVTSGSFDFATFKVSLSGFIGSGDRYSYALDARDWAKDYIESKGEDEDPEDVEHGVEKKTEEVPF